MTKWVDPRYPFSLPVCEPVEVDSTFVVNARVKLRARRVHVAMVRKAQNAERRAAPPIPPLSLERGKPVTTPNPKPPHLRRACDEDA